ncbi:Crp/Fnr family transcriptional regulator [Niabella insulamsoli]|uniref:Crp/Fnr family transcriptional regulator n=1 Tax=Niabella insulamsoli TaxID=3144874 RepID=UPI0031FD1261
MSRKKNTDTSQSFLHSHCLKEWRPALDANLEVLHYKKGAVIFSEQSEVTGIYFMVSGVVKVHKLWDEDKELIVRFAHRQDILGHRGLSTLSKQYPITATALTAVTVCYITIDFFETTFKVNKDFAFAFMMFMADELQLSEIRMRNLAHMTVRARLAGALLSLEQKFGKNDKGFIDFTISRQDIAAYVGTTYETIYKVLAEFSELGLIRTSGKEIGVINRSALQKAIC